jgi:hypothetical protein
MKIAFLFCNPKAKWKQPGSWIIRKLDGSLCSHVAVAVTIKGYTNVFESVSPNSRNLPLADWLNQYTLEYAYDFEVPNTKEFEALSFLDSITERPYSYGQIALIGLTKLFLPLQFLLRGAILNHERALICTEVISLFVEKFMRYTLRKKHDQHGISDIEVMAIVLKGLSKPWKD